MKAKKCPKFLLENAEPLYSGLDGSLFIPSTNEVYSNEEYCVEYFHNIDDPFADRLRVIKQFAAYKFIV